MLRRIVLLATLGVGCHAGAGGAATSASPDADSCVEPERCSDAAPAVPTDVSSHDAAGADAVAPMVDASASIDLAAARDTTLRGGRRDAAEDVADHGADGGDRGALGGSLDGFVFSVECPTRTTDGQCNVPDATRIKTSMPLQLGGDPNVTYRVRLHFCGPVEGRKYAGCARTTFSNDSLLCMDGTPMAMSASDQFVDTYPTYEMKVSAPAHAYFVNSRDLRDTLMKIDYSADLEMRGGASVTFSTTSRGEITFTSRQLQPPITCPDVPGLQQPFSGQFIHVTVESVTAE